MIIRLILIQLISFHLKSYGTLYYRTFLVFTERRTERRTELDTLPVCISTYSYISIT